MTKTIEDLVLTPTEAPKKMGHHLSVASRHLIIQRDQLASKIESLQAELDGIEKALAALSPE